jgi:hypothetical protein
MLWLVVLLFVLFFNSVSSCIRNQLDQAPRSPSPSSQGPLPSR